jgi:hypothetical protein
MGFATYGAFSAARRAAYRRLLKRHGISSGLKVPVLGSPLLLTRLLVLLNYD